MAGGSHTDFDSGAFTLGAAGGAATIAGAMVAGWQNYRAAQADRWHGWNAEQMRRALDYTDSMLIVRTDERDAAIRRIAELERFESNRSFIVKRERARSIQGPR